LSEGSLRHWIRNFQADGLLVVGWPRKIEDGVLALFPFGGVNIHPSVLPKLKGADPIFQVLFHGETGFGVTFHRLNQDLDGGNVLFQTALGVGLEDTYETLYFRFLQVVEKNVGVAMRVWQQCPGGFSQMGQTTRCDPFHPEQAMVHPYESAEDILRKARVFGFHLGVRITLGTHSFRFHRARFEDNGHSSVMQLCENRLQGLLLSTTNGRVWLKRMRHLSFRSRLSLRKGDLVSDPTVENQAMVDK
jgi:methionyl-tRNA formyltransferase